MKFPKRANRLIALLKTVNHKYTIPKHIPFRAGDGEDDVVALVGEADIARLERWDKMDAERPHDQGGERPPAVVQNYGILEPFNPDVIRKDFAQAVLSFVGRLRILFHLADGQRMAVICDDEADDIECDILMAAVAEERNANPTKNEDSIPWDECKKHMDKINAQRKRERQEKTKRRRIPKKRASTP
ncbi:MAG: hypothetical protein ACRYGR_10390 [Janthinobacterium lividum]